MMKKILYMLLALSLGLNAGLFATHLMKPDRPPAPGGPGGPGGGSQMPPPDPQEIIETHLRGMTLQLDLTTEQQKAIRVVLARDIPRLVDFQQRTRETTQSLTEALARPDFDPQVFMDLVEETSEARSALDSLAATLIVAEVAVLTPEQRIKYAEVAPMVHSNPEQAPPLHDPEQAPPPHDPARRPPPRH